MSFYAGRINTGTPAALDTFLHIKGTATTRAGLCEFIISSDASPVEQTGEYQIQRTSTNGTTPAAGNTTIVKLNTFSPAAGCTFDGCSGYTTEPTITDVVMDVSVHQKATFRWVAYPGREILSAFTAAGGIALALIQQSAAFTVNASCVWQE
jgi:hypothetical protein